MCDSRILARGAGRGSGLRLQVVPACSMCANRQPLEHGRQHCPGVDPRVQKPKPLLPYFESRAGRNKRPLSRGWEVPSPRGGAGLPGRR
jgi:hypothetical protein